jgi:hypothetical protein
MTTPDPHLRQADHFIEACGVDSPHNGKIDYCLTTKKGQGQIFYENGDLDIVNDKTSKEVCGRKITNENEPAKIIRAENGGIILSAPYGTVTIVAANIRFVAVDGTKEGGEITFQASKIIHQDSPTNNTQGTNITSAAAQNVSITGSTANLSGNTQAEVQSGIDSDKSSVLGKILDAITKFKDFFKSICSDNPGGK